METANAVIEVKCVVCGTPHTIVAPVDAYRKWNNGEAYIQDALPMLTPAERELLLSGICPVCWDKHFGDE